MKFNRACKSLFSYAILFSCCKCSNQKVVTVAQLVESRIVIPVVVGSSPIGHPKIVSKSARLVRADLCLLVA